MNTYKRYDTLGNGQQKLTPIFTSSTNTFNNLWNQWLSAQLVRNWAYE